MFSASPKTPGNTSVRAIQALSITPAGSCNGEVTNAEDTNESTGGFSLPTEAGFVGGPFLVEGSLKA
jgi:hypothetical protein